MRKGPLVLILGLLLGSAAFTGFYYAGTAPCRHLLQEPQPELAWLKHEFKLSDPEFARITALHEAYLPQCAERCRVIEEQNRKLKGLLAKGATASEVRILLEERAKTRAQCEAEMLQHFQQVSRAMPVEQGRRYLAWVQEETVLRPQAMEARHQISDQHSEATPHRH